MKAKISAPEGSRVETGEAHSQVKKWTEWEQGKKRDNLNIITDGHLFTLTEALQLPPQAS